MKIEAALRWLEAHPTWLMIVDNVDDEKAVAAVGRLMARLRGGHVIVTARAANFPPSLRKLELDVLDENAATNFLLERTRDDRETVRDDEDKARELTRGLGRLALALEQAGAYISAGRISFARYLELWRESREKVVDWFDRTLMSYEHDTGLAATWATSVDRLSPESRRLLDRLADTLAPDPIPDSLIDVAVPDQTGDYDAYRARAGLYAYSLITRAIGEDGSANGFVVHRLVQDFAMRAMTVERRTEALREAIGWMYCALVEDPIDKLSWQSLGALVSHSLTVARRADEAGIAEPRTRLLNEVARLALAKAEFADVELLLRFLPASREVRLRQIRRLSSFGPIPFTDPIAPYRAQCEAVVDGFRVGGAVDAAGLAQSAAGLETVVRNASGETRVRALMELGTALRMSNNYEGAIAAQLEAAQEAEALGLRGLAFEGWIGVARAQEYGASDHGAAAVAFGRATDAAGDSPTEKQRADLAGSLAQLEIGRGELEAGVIDALLAIRLTHDPTEESLLFRARSSGRAAKAGGERLRSSAGRRQEQRRPRRRLWRVSPRHHGRAVGLQAAESTAASARLDASCHRDARIRKPPRAVRQAVGVPASNEELLFFGNVVPPAFHPRRIGEPRIPGGPVAHADTPALVTLIESSVAHFDAWNGRTDASSAFLLGRAKDVRRADPEAASQYYVPKPPRARSREKRLFRLEAARHGDRKPQRDHTRSRAPASCAGA